MPFAFAASPSIVLRRKCRRCLEVARGGGTGLSPKVGRGGERAREKISRPTGSRTKGRDNVVEDQDSIPSIQVGGG